MAARYPWWKKSLTLKKKDAVQRDADSETNDDKSAASSAHIVGSKDISEETYDDSQEGSTFNEHTSRRNLRVSRSGRFKEKRRIRVTLPENNNFHTANTAVAK